MKYLIVVLFFAVNLFASHPRFYVYNINEAMRLSAQYHRPIIYVIASDHCSHCENFLNSISDSDQITDQIKKRYIFALTILEQGGVPKGVDFRGVTPTTYIIKGGQFMTQPIEGEIPHDDILRLLYSF